MLWLRESLSCLLLSLRVVFSTMLEFLFLCGYAGAVGMQELWLLDLSGTVTTSFAGRKLNFYWVFCSFWGCYLFCLNFNFYGFVSCCLIINKVGRCLDLVEHTFWVWPYLGGGTASLKFRQFKSAVCDAFGFFFCFGGLCVGCGLLCRVSGC